MCDESYLHFNLILLQIQCAGEAQYTDDIATMANEVFGAFVLSTVALGTIIKMDATDALVS